MIALGRLLRGLAAVVALLALLVAVPLFLVRAVGNPWPGRDAVGLRDERQLLLGVLAAAAWVVWARFVVAVGYELVVQIGQLRRERAAGGTATRTAAVAAPPPMPSGGIGVLAARLVALALTLVPIGQVGSSGPSPLPFRPAPVATAAAVQPAPAPSSLRPSPPADVALPIVEVQANDSLFRIAERHLGDRARWREVLDLNTDRVQPDGARLTTPSSLRAGWTLLLPADAARAVVAPVAVEPGEVIAASQDPDAGAAGPHVVARGESYWEIAEAQLRSELGRPPSTAETSTRAQQLIRTNAPRLGYSDPAMLHPGDEIVGAGDRSVELAPGTSTHVVAAGESYWQIAEDHLQTTLGRPVSEAEVLDATKALVQTNAPLFAYDDPALIHPGDEVVFPESGWPAPASGVAPPPPADAAAGDPNGTAVAPTAVDATAGDPNGTAVAPTAVDATAGVPAATPPADATSTSTTTTPTTTTAPTTTPTTTTAPTTTPTTTPTTPVAPSTVSPATLPAAVTPRVEQPVPVAADDGRLGPSRGEAIPVTGPPDTAEPDYGELLGPNDHGGRSVAVPAGLGAAVLLAGGALAIVDARRRAALRRAQAHARLRDLTTSPTEVRLRTLDAPARLMRLDLVLRALAAALRDQRSQPVVVLVHRDGTVRASLSAPATLGAPWSVGNDGWWTLPASIGDEELAAVARSSGLPCPAITHVGTSAGADVYIDLEAVGVFAIDGPSGASATIIDAIALGLAVSPFASGATLTMVGVDERIAEVRTDVEIGFDVATATATARSMLGTIGAATAMGASTFGLRSRSTVERWEPVVVVLGAGVQPTEELRELAAPGGHGVALVAAADSSGGATLAHGADGWLLQPWALPIEPIGVAPDDVAAVVELLDEAECELVLPPEPVAAETGDAEPVAFEDRAWDLLVRILGPVHVHDGAGTDARFERSKAQELVCWLTLHRAKATRTGARTALWETDVRDATFANVVSDARRSLARLAAPPPGEEWIGRTLTEALPLHELVASDADLLADRVSAARGLPPDLAVPLLRPGLALVSDLPFAGTGYLWPDAEGIVTELILLGTTAAIEMAQHCLAIGDVEGVFWATGQGLRMLPGHEELVALRMRAHARAGDLAAVRAEWGSYERALAADPWSDAEPASKLVDLRRELLGPAAADYS